LFVNAPDPDEGWFGGFTDGTSRLVLTTPFEYLANIGELNPRLVELIRIRGRRIFSRQFLFKDRETSASRVTSVVKDKYGSSSVNLYENNRSKLAIHLNTDSGYSPNPINDDDAIFDDIIISGISESSRERVHLTQSSGGEKLYSFSREHRLFSVGATIIDTNLTNTVGSGPTSWDGRGLEKWKRFYEKYARLTACARDSRVVVFKYQDRTISGAITEYNLNADAKIPGMYQLVFVFYVCSVA